MSDFLHRLATRGAGFAAVSEPRPAYLRKHAAPTFALLQKPYAPPTDRNGDGDFANPPEDKPERRGAGRPPPKVGLFSAERPEQQHEGVEGRSRALDSNPAPIPQVSARESVAPLEASNLPGRGDPQKAEARANSAEQPGRDGQVIQPRLGAASQSRGGDRLALQQAPAATRPDSPGTPPREWADATGPHQAAVQPALAQHGGNSSTGQAPSIDPIRRERLPKSGRTGGRRPQTVEPRIDSSEHGGRQQSEAGATEPASGAPSSRTKTSPALSVEGSEVSRLANRVAAEATDSENPGALSSTVISTVRTDQGTLTRAERPESTRVEPRPKAAMMGAGQTPANPELAVEVRIGTIEVHAAAEEPPAESRSASESSWQERRPTETSGGFDSFDSVRRHRFWRSG